MSLIAPCKYVCIYNTSTGNSEDIPINELCTDNVDCVSLQRKLFRSSLPSEKLVKRKFYKFFRGCHVCGRVTLIIQNGIEWHSPA